MSLFTVNELHMPLETPLPPVPSSADLTFDQQLLLSGVLLERSDQCIAREMGITAPTVRFRLTYLFRLFGVSDRQGLKFRVQEARSAANR